MVIMPRGRPKMRLMTKMRNRRMRIPIRTKTIRPQPDLSLCECASLSCKLIRWNRDWYDGGPAETVLNVQKKQRQRVKLCFHYHLDPLSLHRKGAARWTPLGGQALFQGCRCRRGVGGSIAFWEMKSIIIIFKENIPEVPLGWCWRRKYLHCPQHHLWKNYHRGR